MADFDAQLHAVLARLDLDVAIVETPFGVPMKTPFPDDREHASYDRDAVERFWRVLDWSASVLEEFSGWFCGKSSPVHLFWHSFDLALTRFSGRRAPALPGRRPGHAGGLHARGRLVRLLGGRPERARAELLLVHRARAGRPPRPGAPPRAGLGPGRAPARSRSSATRPCAPPPTRTRRCWPSSRAPTRRAPTPPAGIAGELASSACPKPAQLLDLLSA